MYYLEDNKRKFILFWSPRVACMSLKYWFHELTETEMPAHTHGYTFPVVAPDTIGVGAPTPSVATVTPSTPTSSTGSGNAHENRPPFLTLVIAVFAGR